MMDRMVWPPSLSRDRKWPSVTKCTHSRVVGLRLEGNLVSFRYMFQDSRVAVFEGFAEYYDKARLQTVAYFQIAEMRGFYKHRVFPKQAYWWLTVTGDESSQLIASALHCGSYTSHETITAQRCSWLVAVAIFLMTHNNTKSSSLRLYINVTRCSAIAERPRCRVCYSFRQT